MENTRSIFILLSYLAVVVKCHLFSLNLTLLLIELGTSLLLIEEKCFSLPRHRQPFLHLLEIYESATFTYVIKEVHEVIGGLSKHLLEAREILNSVKARFYEIAERMNELH